MSWSIATANNNNASEGAVRVLIHATIGQFGGVETHVRQLALSLRAVGAHVTVTSQRHLAFDLASDTELRSAGVFLCPPTLSRNANVNLSLWQSRRLLVRTLDRRSFDIIVGQGHGGAFLWMKRFLTPGGALIWHEYWYGVPTRGDNYELYEAPTLGRFSWRMRRVLRTVDLIVTGCRRAESNLRALQRFSGPIKVLPPLVDCTDALVAQERVFQHDTIIQVVMIARHGLGKGTVALLDAWRALWPQKAHLHLYGPVENDLLSVTLEGHTLDHTGVCWHGTFERSQLPSLLHGADLGLLLSIEEGYGLVACEYMAAGVPLLMTDVGASSEFAFHNPNCMIINIGSAELLDGLKDALLKVRSNYFSPPSLQAWYQDFYNYETVVQGHLAALLSSIGRRSFNE